MTRRAVLAAVLAAGLAASVAACARPAQPPVLPAAGSTADDGTGLLYRASVRYETAARDDVGVAAEGDRAVTRYGDGYGGYQYGGEPFGGGAYGGFSYAGWQANYSLAPVVRQPGYAIRNLADAGAITGTVTWDPPPTVRRLRSPCGEIDNPTLRIGARSEAGGAIVYLDQIAAGRPLSIGGRPLVIGGSVEKIGCAWLPTAQVASPVPAILTVFNDGRAVVGVVHGPATDRVTVALGPGAYRRVGIGVGVTAVTDDAGRAAPAWIVAPGHPYVALTDDAGRYRIDDVVPGTYQLVVWHPPVVTGWVRGVVQHGAPVIVTRTVRVGPNAATTIDVALR